MALNLMAGAAFADATEPKTFQDKDADKVVVTAQISTRSAISIQAVEIQKIIPGVNPLKAIQTLPGVLFVTADPWGNNEQNMSLFVHGFSTQQLGYAMDGVPLGDQQYGNYNGLSPSRALTSENVARVNLFSGAAALGVPSTSNLGGAIETFSRAPAANRIFTVNQTLGSYEATRTFLRFDTGRSDGGGSAFVSYLHHDARAWDFDGHQKADQINVKYVHDAGQGRLTAYFNAQKKVEPNEDATAYGTAQTASSTYFPYTRKFIYPDLTACKNNLTNGTPPAYQGNNFSNCFSAAQREDLLTYVKYEFDLAPKLTWSNQVYYHYNYGRGIVAGPINTAGLPGLFAAYYPNLVVGGATSAQTLQNISALFGGSGYAVRTTEYRINRSGGLSTLNWEIGDHKIDAGVWIEHNEPAQHRVWYPMTAANNNLSPYDVPSGPKALTQYHAEHFVNIIQLHAQDQWQIQPKLLLQYGFKSSQQWANGKFPVNQVNLPTATVPVHFPSGRLQSGEWILPQAGLVWDLTDQEQVFVNAQKNLRQFLTYGAGSGFYGFTPWSLGTQAAFDLFKDTVKPETSWTYEVGLRTRRDLDLGPITAIEGQINAFHVDFQNRLLNIAPFNFINPAPAILANVGDVKTDGVDIAATLDFGPHYRLYNAISFTDAQYAQDYLSGTRVVNGVVEPVTVATGGKSVPLSPKWMNKTVLSVRYGAFEGQLTGDYVGRRYVTYLNDLSVKSNFLIGLQASWNLEAVKPNWAKVAKISANVSNLGNVKGISTAVVTGNSGGYQGFPIPSRMVFVTLSADF
ncbi:TonB-dependent receptor [Candidatus Phycosocius spiralis]|uniref:TonB-dependent receptor n=1 Tax=Candidatus Phycosocius spiralis TaxID=2815099 RepID=A0ABQ4PTR1_9PROT|nr:TonB-dependent receptor [Candidatus Phycosocius spiralis]GIU66401.1 TonB-dependent receptor [Candidatus Phycosocius spiralis]